MHEQHAHRLELSGAHSVMLRTHKNKQENEGQFQWGGEACLPARPWAACLSSGMASFLGASVYHA